MLSVAAISAFLASSCATTYLNSGQFGFDSVAPLPIGGGEIEKAGSTMLFAAGSYAIGAYHSDDDNLFAQLGALRSWRSPGDRTFLDGHLAFSGWYGRTSLEDHGSQAHPQYPLSVGEPFAFYGVSAQCGVAAGFKLRSGTVFDLGIRGGAAYEDGDYREFRADAARASMERSHFDVRDCCPSGWTGLLGADIAWSESAGREMSIREGFLIGILDSNLFHRSDSDLSFLTLQPSVSIRYRRLYLAATLVDNLGMNLGLSCALGYVL